MKKTFKIEGMHCISCEMLVENELKKIKWIKKYSVSHKKWNLEVDYNNTVKVEDIIEAVEKNNYQIIDDNNMKHKKFYKNSTKDYIYIVILFLSFLLVAYFLDKINIYRYFPNMWESASLFVAVILWLVASVSTCLAITGWIIMSFSSSYEFEKDKKHPFLSRSLPQIYFHIWRIWWFAMFGAILGFLWEKLSISLSFTGFITIFVGFVMLYIWLNILNIVPSITKIGFHLPKSLSKHIYSLLEKEHKFIPFIIWALTFFLPCWFTQSMQLTAVASWSPITGALIMAAFAIGTMPVLFAIWVGSTYTQDKDHTVLKKVIWVLIVLFSVFSIVNAYNLLGGFSSFQNNKTDVVNQNNKVEVINEDKQIEVETKKEEIETLNLVHDGWNLKTYNINLESWKKYILSIVPEKNGIGCMSTITIPQVDENTQRIVKWKEIIFNIPWLKSGTYPLVCGMGMLHGQLVVK